MSYPDVDEPHDRTVRWGAIPDVPRSARDRDGERAGAPAGRGFWRTLALGTGELLVTAGLVLLLFVGYEVYVTDLLTAQRQDELAEELRDEWAAAPAPGGEPGVMAPVGVGEPFAVLRIPRLGQDYSRVVLEGTAEAQLSQGPGHYVGSALPGQEGNLAFAGHRVGKGSPFLELDAMRAGDPVVVETADSWFVYRVLPEGDPSGIPGMQIVSPTDVEVVAPTPNAPGAAPSDAYLTLTTCHPRYSARQRLVVHARLDGGALSKAEYPDGPDALTGNR